MTNEMLEMWSLPWHALQRSLAVKATPAAAWSQLAGRTMRSPPEMTGAPVSWLVRARARVQPSARRGQ
jgi:hypothetical protein